jgi:glycosyltransferase involved in cell wall biosynthesis
MNDKTVTFQSKRKVLFLSRLASPHVGGVERHIDEIARELIPRGHDLTVIAEQHDVKLPLEEQTSLYRIIRIPKESRRSKMHLWKWMLQHGSEFLRADVIHVHDVFWWVLPLRLLFPGKKYYMTFHGYEGADEPTAKAIRAHTMAEQFTRGNICIGDWMRKWYHTKPSFVSYGAARLSRKPAVPTASAIFFGRLSSDTGILEYIQGVKLLHGQISLDIFGEGELLKNIEAEIQSAPFISYRGVAIDTAARTAHYRFAFVSRYLGMIEAMQTGRYVFAQWNNAIKRDYLESFPAINAATLFTYPEELAQELKYILDHPQKEKNAVELAGDWAKQQTWDKVATIYEELWKR